MTPNWKEEAEKVNMKLQWDLNHDCKVIAAALRKAKADGMRAAADMVMTSLWSPEIPEPASFEMMQSPVPALRARADSIEAGEQTP